jgi:predicted AAA+ superfamily ATPase
LALPQVSESLAGRMETVSLLPLSQVEVRGGKPAFLKTAFAGRIARPQHLLTGNDLVNAVLTGGYPEMLRRKTPARRQAWAREYLKALLQRDVRDIAEVEKLDGMSRLFRALAQHSGGLVNFARAGGRIGLDDKTARKYVTIFEQLFVVRRVEPWLRNRLKRLVKTPKLHFLDSGLLATTLGATAARIAKDRAILGPLLEAFVFSEVLKQAEWLGEDCTLHHYRDKDQDEVDVVVENHDGAVVGVEVKAAATVGAGDFRGLRKLADACGKELRLGAVLYDGEQVVPFGERLFAAPVSCLWG